MYGGIKTEKWKAPSPVGEGWEGGLKYIRNVGEGGEGGLKYIRNVGKDGMVIKNKQENRINPNTIITKNNAKSYV